MRQQAASSFVALCFACLQRDRGGEVGAGLSLTVTPPGRWSAPT